jgi:predicted small lipoprotein YifL
MVPLTQGVGCLNRLHDRRFVHLALIGALAAALGLAACGRKGDLDPPPSARLAGEQSATPNPMSNPIGSPIGGESKGDKTALGPNGLPLSPQGPKKHIFLDDLLN